MTNTHKFPLGDATELNWGNVSTANVFHVKQVIGLGINVAGGDIEIVGKRWPGDDQYYSEPRTPMEIQGFVNTVKNMSLSPLDKEDALQLLDIQVQHTSLIFVTTNIDNLYFRSHVISEKAGKDWDGNFRKNSVKLEQGGQTVMWNTDYVRNAPDGRKFGYDILAELRQERSGPILTLPIIIDPGTENGGVGGWPT